MSSKGHGSRGGTRRGGERAPSDDDLTAPPTRVRKPRPPSRNMLEASPFGAPTREHHIDPLPIEADSDDVLTRVSPLARRGRKIDEAAAEVAPTRLRPVSRRPRPGGSTPPEDVSRDSDPPPDSEPPPPPEGDDITGRRIGNCQLGRAFASGGLASVHLGHWFGAGGFTKTVAVKRLLPQMASDAKLVAMLLDEARVVARIRHGNVTSVLDVLEHEGEVLIVMELVRGVTLAHLVRQMKRRGEKIPVPIAMRVAIDVLHGIQAAHEATDDRGRSLEIIHRDVSPENIIVGVDGSAQLIDFGFARALGRNRTTEHGQIKGKLRYCSPEQLRGDELESASDIYAASIVIWEMVCGRRLFREEDPAAVVQSILDSDVTPPSRLRDALSDVFDAIVLRGLDPDRNQRWLTAADMAEALDRVTSKASPREVGDWVKSVAEKKLAALATALEELEALPSATDKPDRSDEEVSVRQAAPVAVAPAPAQGRGLWLLAAALLVAGVAIAIGARKKAPPPSPAPSVERVVTTVFVPVPVSPSTPPVAATSAVTAPAVPPPRPTWRPRPRPKPKAEPKDWIPDGI